MPGKAAAVDAIFPRIHRPATDGVAGSANVTNDGAALAPAERGFLLKLQQQALQYFLDNQVPGGLILDRRPFALWPLAAAVCLVAAGLALVLDGRLPSRLRRVPHTEAQPVEEGLAAGVTG